MYALITCGIVFIVFLILAILCFIDWEGEFGGLALGVLIVAVFIFALSLIFGTSIKKQKVDISKKAYIEYALENNPSLYIIEQAQSYNRDIDFGNNLWCRFSIEDRSEYKINLDKYIKNKEE